MVSRLDSRALRWGREEGDMAAEQDEAPEAEAPPPHHRFTAADARQKAEFILSRAYGLLRDPKAEWEQIRREDTNIPSILLGYVAPLALIPPLCGVIGSFVFGARIAEETVRPPIDAALIGAAVSFIASVVLVFFLGLLINAVADNFDADRDDVAAQKVAAYAMTPAFLSGLFSLWPPLWWLSLVAIAAAIFLLYRGLPILMKTPEDRAMGYTATVAISGLVAFIILFSLTGCVTGVGRL
jgi:hypothetical protein